MTLYENLLSADRPAQTEDPEIDAAVDSHPELRTHDGTVDYKGRPANKARTGGWRVAPYICGMELTEKIATAGAQFNLVSYLTIDKKLPLPYAANIVTNYLGTSFIFSLLGGFLADSFFGRYHVLIAATLIEILGFFVMMLTVVLPILNNQDEECLDPSICTPVHDGALAVIYVGLCFGALGVGGIKATASPFGADQFEYSDPVEAKLLPSYFNWFYWGTTLGSLITSTLLIYIQDHVGWDWGYGMLIPIMALALGQLVFKRRSFRYRIPKGSPLVTVSRVVVAAIRNCNLPPLTGLEVSKYYEEMQSSEERIILHTNSMRWLDKAAKTDGISTDKVGKWERATLSDVEDVKMVLRLLPVGLFTVFYWTILAQATTFTLAQTRTTDRHLGPNFEVPPGSVAPLIFNLTGLFLIPMYDRLFVPFISKFTGNPKGITVLQRIGAGMAIPVVAMIIAALVESKRLSLVKEMQLEDEPDSILPFSMLWFVPQYVILAVAETCVYPGQLDFFYSEAPDSMQSLGTALMFCTISGGYFFSTAIVSMVDRFTKTSVYEGWLQKNVNTSRLDKYYLLLTVVAFFNFFCFLLVSRLHQYKQVSISGVHPADVVEEDTSSDSSRALLSNEKHQRTD